MDEPNDIERQERIEAYVNGALTGEALRTFEAELDRDPGLRSDVETERTLRATLQRGQELRFRDLVQQVSDQQERGASGGGGAEPPVIPIDRGRWKWWGAAASVAVLLGVGAMMVWPSGGGSEAEKFQEFAYVDIPLTMDRGAGDLDVVDSVHVHLSGTFKTRILEHRADPELISLFEEALTDSVYRSRYRTPAGIMLARVYLSSGMPDEAEKALENSLAEVEEPCAYRYYMAVACLEKGDNTSAKALTTLPGCSEIQAAYDRLEQAQ